MRPDFNDDLAGFGDRSRVRARGVAAAVEDAGPKHAALAAKAARMAFESFVIFGEICPGQRAALFREDFSGQLHDFHSAESRKLATGSALRRVEFVGRRAAATCVLEWTSPASLVELEAELQAERAAWEARGQKEALGSSTPEAEPRPRARRASL